MAPPSRDRLARPIDISTLFQGAARRVNLVVDEPGLRWAGLSGNLNRNVSGNDGSGLGGSRGGVYGVGIVRGRNLRRENRTPARRGGARIRGSSVLPYWYPRTPLRDITAIVAAIDRRRAELHEAVEAPHDETNAPTPSRAHLEPEIGVSTPIPTTIAVKPQPSPATQPWRIMGDKKGADSEFLTPQKLLNSIEKVREVWLEEQQKLARTPAARKTEREKKVRTLMSMR